MGVVGVLVLANCDMREWSSTFYFPAHNAIEYACPLCWVDRNALHDLTGWSVLTWGRGL